MKRLMMLALVVTPLASLTAAEPTAVDTPAAVDNPPAAENAIEIASPGAAVSNPRLDAYRQRLASRRLAALETRRQYNAAKGPHVYRTATALNVRPFIAIEQGLVVQPPIPVVVRPAIGVRYFDPYYRTPYVRHYHGDGHPYSVARR